MPPKKAKENEDTSVEMSNPAPRDNAPAIVDPLEPQNLVYSPRPTRQRKPSQKMNRLSIDADHSPPPIFPTPRVSRRKSKKRAHPPTDDDEIDDVEDANESEDANEHDEDDSFNKTTKKTRGIYQTKKRRLEALQAQQAAIEAKKGETLAEMGQDGLPLQYKSPYQQPPALLTSPTASPEVEASESAKAKKTTRAYNKKKSEPSPVQHAQEVPEAKKRQYNKRAPGPTGYLAPIHVHPPLSMAVMAQQHEALVINIASTLSREQLFNMVTYGCTHPEARLFDLLLAENSHRPTVFNLPGTNLVGHLAPVNHGPPVNHVNHHVGPMNQIVRAPQFSQPPPPPVQGIKINGQINGNGNGNVNSNGNNIIPASGNVRSSKSLPSDDDTEEEDEDHASHISSLPSEDDDDDFETGNNATQRNRLVQRALKEGQWKTSSKAYLVPKGKNPPVKGPIAVGVAKRGKNVVHAGFDYRMRFHWRLTKHDREGNLVAYNGRTPATSRDKVDLHPTLANLSEEDFYAEVLRRQYAVEN